MKTMQKIRLILLCKTTDCLPLMEVQNLNSLPHYHSAFGAPPKRKSTSFGKVFPLEGQESHNANFTPAFSLIVNCDTQEEIDHYWNKLSEGGTTGQCGWLTDKFGVSWQINPSMMADWMTNPKKSEQMMKEMLEMKKLDIKKLKDAYDRLS